MEWIAIALVAAVLAALLISWQRSRKPAGQSPQAQPGMEEGTLTLSGVSPRPVEPDQNGDAFAMVSGQIVGPTIAPASVYRQLIVKFADRWPEVGDQLPVYYKVGKVDTSWQFGSLAPPPEQPGGPGQYPG